MKNEMQPGVSLDLIAGGTLTGGTGQLVGATFGVIRHSAVSGQRYILDLEGVFALPKAATITPAPGALLYWDNAASNVTTTVGSNTKIGVHAGPVASLAGDATVPVRLNGAF
jgi:predicted RecA/RadA family phage recombinase